jgi:hypothetical protein
MMKAGSTFFWRDRFYIEDEFVQFSFFHCFDIKFVNRFASPRKANRHFYCYLYTDCQLFINTHILSGLLMLLLH